MSSITKLVECPVVASTPRLSGVLAEKRSRVSGEEVIIARSLDQLTYREGTRSVGTPVGCEARKAQATSSEQG